MMPVSRRYWIGRCIVTIIVVSGVLMLIHSQFAGQRYSGLFRQVFAASNRAPVYGYEVINAYPHDQSAFTQGLVFENGFLYESTGLYGQSSLRKVDLATGNILKIFELSDSYFGEGMTIHEDTIVQLTWLAHVGFLYVEQDTFELVDSFNYSTQGWGLTHNDSFLIMSDGSPTLRFLDPVTYEVVREIYVRADSIPLAFLNELEYIQGYIYANVWFSDSIAIIDPRTGDVFGWLNLAGISAKDDSDKLQNVLNGIAYDSDNVRLFVTGKLWPTLYEIRVDPLDYPPCITSVSPLSPCSIEVDSVLRLTISVDDPDQQDSLVYAWYIDGTVDTSAQDSVYFYESSIITVDTIMVEVNDGVFCDSVLWIINVIPNDMETAALWLYNTTYLLHCYPNPFKTRAMIAYVVPAIDTSGRQGEKINISIYDVAGRLVRTIVDDERSAGYYSVCFEPDELKSGIYFVNLVAESQRLKSKLILLR